VTLAPDALIAIVRTSAIGDVVLASAVIEALATRARVVLITSERCAPLYEGDPRLERVVTVDPAVPRLPALPRLSAVLDLQGTHRSRRLVAKLPHTTSRRVHKDSVRRRLALLRWRAGWRPIPAYRRYLATLEALTGQREGAKPRLVVSESYREEASRLLGGAVPWIGFAPGAAWANKRWPIERFVEAARRVVADGYGAVFVFGPGENRLRDHVRHGLGEGPKVVLVEPPLALLPALAERTQVVVTGDSAPVHIAEAVGTPVVALFGPTIPEFGFAPFREESRVIARRMWCRPCHVHGGDRCPLGHHRCLRDIDVDEVVHAVLDVARAQRSLASGGSPPGPRREDAS
jgi:heptosyltransferase-2